MKLEVKEPTTEIIEKEPQIKVPEVKKEPEMSPEEARDLLNDIYGGYPRMDTQYNVHKLINDVIKAKDTTKTGNLSLEELGMPRLPLRSYKEIALFSDSVAGLPYFAAYFNAMGEIATSTSLSLKALLLRLAVTTKKELADTSPKGNEINKGWFKSKSKDGNDNSLPNLNV